VKQRAAAWRDADSNRGHHDFQSCGVVPESRLSAGISSTLGCFGGVRIFRTLRTFAVQKGPWRGPWAFSRRSGSSRRPVDSPSASSARSRAGGSLSGSASPPWRATYARRSQSAMAAAEDTSAISKQQRLLTLQRVVTAARIRPTGQRANARAGAQRLLLCREAGVSARAPARRPKWASAEGRLRRSLIASPSRGGRRRLAMALLHVEAEGRIGALLVSAERRRAPLGRRLVALLGANDERDA
jgi:hypothetical protein